MKVLRRPASLFFRSETDLDATLVPNEFRNLRAKIEGQSSDENEFASDYRHRHYLQNIARIEIKQDVLARKYYKDTGMISHYQILLPKQKTSSNPYMVIIQIQR